MIRRGHAALGIAPPDAHTSVRIGAYLGGLAIVLVALLSPCQMSAGGRREAPPDPEAPPPDPEETLQAEPPSDTSQPDAEGDPLSIRFPDAAPILPDREIDAVVSGAPTGELYRMDLTEPGNLVVETVGQVDTYGYLFDDRGEIINYDDDSGEGDNFRFGSLLSPGTYFVQVESFDIDQGGVYRLISRFIPEIANEIIEAETIEIGRVFSDEIMPQGDRDYVRFRVPAIGLLTINAEYSISILGTIHDANGEEIYTERSLPAQFLVEQGTHYLQIRSLFAETTGRYSLEMEFLPSRPIAVDEIAIDTIDRARGSHLYHFRLSRPGRVEIATEGDTDTAGRLLDERGMHLSRNDDGGDHNFHIVQSLPTGLFHVLVSGADDRAIGDYLLQVTHSIDHGDDLESADPLLIETRISASIYPVGDRDVFRLENYHDGFVIIEVTGDLPTEATLFDASGRSLAMMKSQNDGADEEQLRFSRLTSQGAYFIAINSAPDNRLEGDYKLFVRLKRPTVIEAGSMVDAELNPAVDIDYFALLSPEDSQLFIETRSAFQLDIQILNADGEPIEAIISGAGRHYLCVQSRAEAVVPYTVITSY